MYTLFLENKDSSIKIAISQENGDFMIFFKVGDRIKIDQRCFVIDEIRVDRYFESTHPMIEPPGFNLFVNVTFTISEILL